MSAVDIDYHLHRAEAEELRARHATDLSAVHAHEALARLHREKAARERPFILVQKA